MTAPVPPVPASPEEPTTKHVEDCPLSRPYLHDPDEFPLECMCDDLSDESDCDKRFWVNPWRPFKYDFPSSPPIQPYEVAWQVYGTKTVEAESEEAALNEVAEWLEDEHNLDAAVADGWEYDVRSVSSPGKRLRVGFESTS